MQSVFAAAGVEPAAVTWSDHRTVSADALFPGRFRLVAVFALFLRALVVAALVRGTFVFSGLPLLRPSFAPWRPDASVRGLLPRLGLADALFQRRFPTVLAGLAVAEAGGWFCFQC